MDIPRSRDPRVGWLVPFDASILLILPARDHTLTVLCKADGRAAIAASILDAADIPVRLVASGGASGWTDRFAALSAAPAKTRG